MEKTPEELELMKRDLIDKHQAAVTAAHEYACALPLGDDRVRAFEIFQNLRLAACVN